MLLSDYSYELPDELIAKHPPQERGGSRLLVLNRASGVITDSFYRDLASWLRPGDLLVLNNTRVIPSRIMTKKSNGALREIIILERHGNEDYASHKIMYHGHLSDGDELFLDSPLDNHPVILIEKVLGDGLAMARSLTDQSLLDLALQYGSVPLPPYLKRQATPDDQERYQTVFAEQNGSAAAPTASLNFTDHIKADLLAHDIKIAYLTLHVGLGTFLPIRSDKIENHTMHREYFEIPPETIAAINQTRASGGRIITLGTTVARTLEYAANQILSSDKLVSGEADIFIYPGYDFKLINGLLTNFHAPKSTVLMLTGAFAGWNHLMSAYSHAIAEKYHFLSYGDSMLIV